jgi:hypothetical protein
LAARAADFNDLRRPDEALAAADGAIALAGARAFRAQIARAIALLQLQRTEEAREAAERGLVAVEEALAGGDPDALPGKIALLRLLGRDNEAVTLAATALDPVAQPRTVALEI